MKKLVSLSLIASIIITLFSGCSKEVNTNNDNSQTTTVKTKDTTAQEKSYMDNGIAISAPGEFPIVKEPVTLDIMIEQSSTVEDYTDNKLTKHMEELTGVKIKWQLVPQKDRQQKINLILASNSKMPDVFMGCYITPDIQDLYGQQGMFVPMNDLIEEHGVEVKRFLEKEEEAKKMLTTADGNIYGLPKFASSINNSASVKAWMYMPFLEKLGINKPKTTEQLYNVLKAIKEKDPNGNGKADEIPMMGASNGWHTMPQRFLMNSFIFYDEDAGGIFVKDGKIDASYNKPEFREGLRYIKKLVDEKLLDVTSWSQDKNQLKQVGESDVPVLGTVTAGGVNLFANPAGERGRGFDTIEPLEGPQGVKNAWFDPYQPYGLGQFVITSACKYPIVAYKFADAMMSEDISMRSRYGEPGVDYIKNPAGKTDMSGNPAKFEPVLAWGSVQKSHWAFLNPGYLSKEIQSREAAIDKWSINIWMNSVTLRDYYPHITKNKVPPLSIAPDSNEEKTELGVNLTSYYKEAMLRFIMGELDLNKDWDNYVKEIKKMGLDRFLEINQAAYDKTWK